MNRSGFTTIEVIIASALIITLITGGAVGMRQINLMNQVASTRTSHTEMRTRVLAALSNSNWCAAALGNPTLVTPAVPITVNEIKDETSVIILEDGKPAPGDASDGLTYQLALRFPTGALDAQFKSGLGRTQQTSRYPVELEIRGERTNLKQMGGAQGDVVGRIPLSAEFETASRKLVSCTTRHDDMEDELLAGSQHTVRDCLKADGMPMPTAIGVICRLPVPTAIQTVKGYKGAIPNCNTFADGTWKNAVPGLNNYNTTLPIDVEGRGCKGTVKGVTGWHSMSPVPVESKTIRIKKGTSDLLSILLGGTAFSALVVVAFVPVVGWIITAAVLLIAFVFSLFKKCKKQNFTFYAQVNGVGCI